MSDATTSFIVPADRLRQQAEEAVIAETANRSFAGHMDLARRFWRSPGKADAFDFRVRMLVKQLSGEAHAIVDANTVKPRQVAGVAYDPTGWSFSPRLGFRDANGVSRPETTARRAGVPVDAMKARATKESQGE